MIKKIGLFWILIFSISASATPVFGDEFTQKDREVLVELKVKMGEIDKRFEQIDKRFEQIDKRFEQIDKRFEQIDKRFEELRSDMNNRFEQMMEFLKIMTALFGGLIVALIGFVLWDRRTLLKEAKREAIEYVEKDSIVIKILREYAVRDEKMREVLKSFRIL